MNALTFDLPTIAQAQRLRAKGFPYWDIAREIGLSSSDAYYAVNDSPRTTIALGGRNGIRAWTLVDPGDYRRLAGYHWHLGSDGYAYRHQRFANGRRKVPMHRVILGLDRGRKRRWEGDHINGNRLDNRRSNLRVVTRAENMQNLAKPRGISRFRGVYRNGPGWGARAQLDGKPVAIGFAMEELDAAVLAQRWRDEHMPFAQPDQAIIAELGSWPPPATYVMPMTVPERMSKRRERVVELRAEGLSQYEIADLLGVAQTTVSRDLREVSRR